MLCPQCRNPRVVSSLEVVGEQSSTSGGLLAAGCGCILVPILAFPLLLIALSAGDPFSFLAVIALAAAAVYGLFRLGQKSRIQAVRYTCQRCGHSWRA